MQENVYAAASVRVPRWPRAFILKRLHSLAGLSLVLFLFEHLLTNSQAAFFLSDQGAGFIRAVNFIQSLPYVHVVELTFIAFPIFVHGWLGIQYLFSAQLNSFPSDGTRPALPELPRNQAYTWQRITAVVLVAGIFLHVSYMRFLKYPDTVTINEQKSYIVKVAHDKDLPKIASQMHVELFTTDFLTRQALKENEVIAAAPSFGAAVLLSVRDAFQSIPLCCLYTIFVLAACFHAMNGVWTFAISWGIALTERSRMITRYFSNAVMCVIVLLGLTAIWGAYWIRL